MGNSCIGIVDWKILMEHISKYFINKSSMANFFIKSGEYNEFVGRGEEYQYTVIRNFGKAILEQNFTFRDVKLNYIFLVIVIGAMYLFLKRLVEIQQRKKFAVYTLTMYLSVFAYTIGLLLLYVFTYSEYEAVHVASFQRYISTWFVAIFIFLGAVLLERLLNYNAWLRAACLGITGYALLSLSSKIAIYDYTLYKARGVQETIEYRQQYEGIEKYLSILDYKVDRVHIVAQNSTGGEWLNSSFAITPVKTIGAWSLGEPYYEDDFYTRNYTLEEYLQVLNDTECTYVYLAKIDLQFVIGYEGAFLDKSEIEQGCLYKIERSEDRTYLAKVEI